jgi:hypothetical protein
MAATVSSVQAQPRPGQGSLGAHLGVPYFFADKDLRLGQRPRILGQFHFQYKASPRWRFSSEFGYGWVGYSHAASPYKLFNPASGESVSTKEDVLTKFQPVTVSALYSLRPTATKWAPYVGGGLNLTRMEITNRRKKIQDPATFRPWVHWSPGVQGELGTELYLKSNHSVTLDWSLRGDYQLSKDTNDFPSGFTGNDGYVALNFGVNVYFWPGGKRPIEIAPAPTPAPEPVPAPATPEVPPPAPPATPDTTKAPVPSATPDTTTAPVPPATPDTTHVPPPPPAPPAPPDTTKHGAQAAPEAAVPEVTFGAFGVPLPTLDPDPAVCPAPAAADTPARREEVVEPR